MILIALTKGLNSIAEPNIGRLKISWKWAEKGSSADAINMKASD